MNNPQPPTPLLHELPTLGRRHQIFWRIVDQYWELFVILAVILKLALPMIAGSDFWYDESISGIIIQQPWNTFFHILMVDPNNTQQPLFHIVAKILTAPFGYSAAAIRGVSLLGGIAIVVGIYCICRQLFNRTAATLAALVAATSPFVLQYATEARMYSLMGATVIWAAYFQIRAVITGRWRDHLLWGALMGLAALAHYLALIYILLLISAYPWQIASQRRAALWENIATTARHLFHRLPKLGATLISGTVVFLPWLPIFITEFITRNNLWIPKPRVTDLTSTTAVLLFGSFPRTLGMPTAIPFRISLLNELTQYFLLPILTIIATWLVVHRRHWRTGIVLTAWLAFGSITIAYLLMFWKFHFMISRFLFPTSLFFAILFGTFFAKLRFQSRVVAIAIFALMLLLREPYDLPTGFTQLTRASGSQLPAKTLYFLNAFDYNVAKFYLPTASRALYNISNPNEDFSSWETIEPFRRILQIDDIAQDPDALLVVNVDLPPDHIALDKFKLVGQYDNLLVYRPR